MSYYLGIDPGSRNLGYAVLNIQVDSIEIVKLGHLDPKELGFFETVNTLIPLIPIDTESVYIERYVAYQGIHNPASEEILMLIGALRQAIVTDLGLPETQLFLVRAIDWKSKLCKYLVRTKKFSNPSTSFDKKYSIAAAECIVNKKIKSDHEADAICLAFFGYINDTTIHN